MRILLLSAALPLPLIAQGPIDAGPPMTAYAEAHVVSGPTPDIPAPPAGVLTKGPKSFIPVPPGPDVLPQPNNQPHDPLPEPQQSPLAAPGDFTYYYNHPVDISGGSRSQTGEPTVAVSRDAAVYTGNWYAGLSRDSGRSWSYVNPYTRFPAIDGGFCCDQRTYHSTFGADDMTLWWLEYSYSSSTSNGSLRIARARGRDGLRADSWTYWNLPATLFGQTNKFLDYGDLCAGTTHLYGSCIIGNPPNSAAGLLLFRIPLQQLYDGVGINIVYYTTAQLGGYGSYRFAQGSTSDMYWAAHENTSTLRVYRWNETTGNAQIFSRSVPAWSGSATPAPGPDGRDWTGFGYTVNTVLTGHRIGSEVAFWWTSGSVSGRPNTFVRVCRFDPSSINLLGTFDLYSLSAAYHFPGVATNSLGHVGGVATYGGGTAYPSMIAFLLDNYNSYASWASYYARQGGAGPTSNRWGDYAQTVRNSNLPATFSAAGYTRQGTTIEPQYVWFGREENQPTWVNVAIESSGVTGVPITVDEHDRFDRTNGNTNFTRVYPQSQGYTLTAPATHVVGSITYVFCNWALRVSPTGTFTEQPAGQRTLTVDTIGLADDTAIARYAARRTLTVQSSNPNSGVPITVDIADLNGLQNGTTTFTRQYKNDFQVTLTAPTQGATNRPFRRWLLNGVAQTTGNRVLNVVMNRDNTAVAQFWTYTPGQFTSFSTGCSGSSGRTPIQSGTGTPELGQAIRWNVSHTVTPSAPGAFYLGGSNRVWNGQRLPLPLAAFGMGSCTLDVSLDLILGIGLDARGAASIPLTLGRDVSLIGQSLFTQFAIVDRGAPHSTPIVHSNGLQTLIGGNQ